MAIQTIKIGSTTSYLSPDRLHPHETSNNNAAIGKVPFLWTSAGIYGTDSAGSSEESDPVVCTYDQFNWDNASYSLSVPQVNGKLNGPIQTTNTSTNSTYYLSFVNSSSNGYRYTYVDSNLYYNPSTNTLTGGKLLHLIDNDSTAGKGAGIWLQRFGQNDGTYDWQMWVNSGSLTFSYNNVSWYDVFSSDGKNFTMNSGSIITPKDDNEGILPNTDNYGQIGSSSKKFYRMYASTFYGSLDGPIKTTNTSTNASYYISFVNNSSSGNRYSYIDSNLYYNPATNILTTSQFTGSFYGPVQTTSTSTNASYYISFVNASATGMRYSYVDSNLYYNPSTNTLTVPKIKYTSTAQQWIGGKTLTNNAFYPSNNFTTTAFFPILAAKTSGENVISLGGLGDQYGFFGYKKDTTENKTDWHFKWDSNNGNTYVTGKIYGTATHADNINVSAATANTTYYVSFVNGTSGARIPYTDAGLYYNPSTNELSSSGGFYERSDERLKDLQEDIEVNFSYLHNIPKKYYSWKDDAAYTRHIGTSAQEVQKYYPELVNTDETGYLTMNYDKLSVVALKAIDVLHDEITELKKENAELKERLARLEELILNK